jgi:hypothetical protein
MVIEDEKAAKIQELLKQLSAADTFQSVGITREIREIASESSQQGHQGKTGNPVAINPAQR